MGWKNLPYWLRGSIVGLIAGIFLGIYLITTNCNLSFGGSSGGCTIFDQIIFGFCLFTIIMPLFVFVFEQIIDSSSAGLIASILTLTFLGALIGFIVGKIKSRKQT